jgi:hypothetical protein
MAGEEGMEASVSIVLSLREGLGLRERALNVSGLSSSSVEAVRGLDWFGSKILLAGSYNGEVANVSEGLLVRVN